MSDMMEVPFEAARVVDGGVDEHGGGVDVGRPGRAPTGRRGGGRPPGDGGDERGGAGPAGVEEPGERGVAGPDGRAGDDAGGFGVESAGGTALIHQHGPGGAQAAEHGGDAGAVAQGGGGGDGGAEVVDWLADQGG